MLLIIGTDGGTMRTDQDTLEAPMNRRDQRIGLLRLVAVAALAILLISCDGSGPTAPAGDDNPPASETPQTPGFPWIPDTSATPDTTTTPPDTTSSPTNPLDSTLVAERARIALRYEASEPEYESLHVLWLEIQLDPLLEPLSPLLQCQPLQYDGAAQIVGPGGGVIRVGTHVITIPPGALGDSTVISAEADPALAVGVTFLPEGLQFQKPIILDLDYGHCNGLLALLRFQPFRGAYVDDQGNVLSYPNSSDDRLHRRLRIDIDPFSQYAGAY